MKHSKKFIVNKTCKKLLFCTNKGLPTRKKTLNAANKLLQVKQKCLVSVSKILKNPSFKVKMVDESQFPSYKIIKRLKPFRMKKKKKKKHKLYQNQIAAQGEFQL